MTRVMIVYGVTKAHELARKTSSSEVAEVDMVIGLNEDGSEGTILKDRYGKADVPVKVVS